ncbi:MAG: hypothetical protein ACJASX_002870 [Limisphaerales bacterium]
MHATQEAKIVGVTAEVWEEAGDRESALANLVELPRGAEEGRSIFALLAIVGGELGFVVEGINVAR